ncbi:MAG: L-serine ammonia-lyase, iron-sulfur-dependent subunit beta [Lachnospiraceae bacterium]
MNIFDILGPVMVGPSSSHTAGAVRIGYMARKLLQDEPVYADIILHGSFATTGVGHGTDKALIAGLLGMQPDDIRIPDSFQLARKEGLKFEFTNKNLRDAHPNTAVLTLAGRKGRSLQMQAASIGGGRILVHRLDGIEVNFSAEKPTLVVHNQDMPGHVAKVTGMLADKGINIATMQLYRAKKGGYAVMVLELDQCINREDIQVLEGLDGIIKVTYIDMEEETHGV